MVAEEERDDDLSGVPDVYEEDDPAYHLRVAAVYERKAAEHRRIAEEMESARLAEVAGGPAVGTARSGMLSRGAKNGAVLI
ncbi:hypothetical protein SVIOM342S_07501 [Streptomyces violaceorubidus]